MEREFVAMTYKPDDEPKPVSVWAEVTGVVTDGLVELYWEVDDYGKRVAAIHTLVGEDLHRKPARLNPETGKMERVRK